MKDVIADRKLVMSLVFAICALPLLMVFIFLMFKAQVPIFIAGLLTVVVTIALAWFICFMARVCHA